MALSTQPSPALFSVRPASDADAAALHDLAAATFPLACPPGTRQEDSDEFVATHLSVERMRDYLEDETRELLVAESPDSSLLGYTMLVFAEPTDPDVAAAIALRPTAELSKCYVAQAAHGAGVGQALIDASVASAVVRGAASVWLGVNQLNGRANRFYERNGFALAGTKRFLVGVRLEDDFVRERVL